MGGGWGGGGGYTDGAGFLERRDGGIADAGVRGRDVLDEVGRAHEPAYWPCQYLLTRGLLKKQTHQLASRWHKSSCPPIRQSR